MTRPRRGLGLLEVLVALPLTALLGAVMVHLLLSVHRQVVRDDGILSASRELRQGAHILAAELRTTRATDVIAWSDTMIEFESTVGVGIVCAAEHRAPALTLVGGGDEVSVETDTDALARQWNQPPQAGDRVMIALAAANPIDSGGGVYRTLRSMSAGVLCAGSPLLVSATDVSTHLILSDSLPGAALVGAPVRVTRGTRYSLYRAGDGDWFLGRRTRGATGWDVVQPVAGPLNAPSERGLVITVLNRSGAAISNAAQVPSHIRISMRAPRRAGRSSPAAPGVDSLATVVVLRADHERGAP